ncbi:MAG: hypothetical protein C0483_08995 [Pirellula sp.]|nr:hypothetical protein [Pirellula sp.]
MIDIENEVLISLAEAAALVPCGRKGRNPDVKTLYAWTKNGCRGVVLESVQLGARRGTSREAIRRFVEALTAKAGCPQMSSKKEAEHNRRALESELDRLGVR